MDGQADESRKWRAEVAEQLQGCTRAEVLNEVPTPQERSRLLFWTIVGCLAALGGCFAALSTATP